MNKATRVVFSMCFAIVSIIIIFNLNASAESTPAGADNPCPAPKIRNDIRPGDQGDPVKVTVSMHMIDLMEISDVKQTLVGDFGVILSWVDPRLSHLEGCEIPIANIWSPGLVFRNSGRKFTNRPLEVGIGSGGRVKYVQRYSGTFATYHKLSDFPFDNQIFRISLSSLEWPEENVRLVADQKKSDQDRRLNITDWVIKSVEASTGRQYIAAMEKYTSRYDFNISAERIKSYYVWKAILPLCLIVAMSWCVFWINPAMYGPQIGLSATSMLTLIAFIFATTNMVPKLGYLTLLDRFIIGSVTLVFLALFESLCTVYFVSKEKKELALRIDFISRFVFPTAFVALFLTVFIFNR